MEDGRSTRHEANLQEVIKGLCSEMAHSCLVDILSAKTSHSSGPTISGMEKYAVELVDKDEEERKNSEPMIHPSTLSNSFRTVLILFTYICSQNGHGSK